MSAPARSLATLILGCTMQLCLAQQPPVAPAEQTQHAPAAASEDRLLFSADGAWLTGGSGGAGASALWSHTFAPRDVLSAGVEHQRIADAHWTTGALSGSLALGSGTPSTSIYAEAHEGAGEVGQRGFNYSVVTAGFLTTPSPWLSVALEERRIDVDTSHGNLPKLTLAFHVAQPLLLSVSYADTLGGNLGTRLTTLRLDYVGQSVTALGGASRGPAAPAVLNLLGQTVEPGPQLTELFAGLGRSFARSDWQLLADYLELGGFKRTTVTLLYTLHLDGHGRPP
ncbi:MAG TPA: hypothetical protein VET46_03105 [Steroidobacteraceae bacterium]|nr:hypothetical protein [Steroidobacteraceae bacterium]